MSAAVLRNSMRSMPLRDEEIREILRSVCSWSVEFMGG
ncbi:hypothetical protein [uncultured Alistipes sp.]